MAVIGIEYNGGTDKPIEYKQVYLTLGDETKFEFKSGDFVKDWYEAKKKFLEFHKTENGLTLSPSVDQFIEDGAEYSVGFITIANGTPEFSYEAVRGWPMFVKKGTKPNWKEYKEYCKS